MTLVCDVTQGCNVTMEYSCLNMHFRSENVVHVCLRLVHGVTHMGQYRRQCREMKTNICLFLYSILLSWCRHEQCSPIGVWFKKKHFGVVDHKEIFMTQYILRKYVKVTADQFYPSCRLDAPACNISKP